MRQATLRRYGPRTAAVAAALAAWIVAAGAAGAAETAPAGALAAAPAGALVAAPAGALVAAPTAAGDVTLDDGDAGFTCEGFTLRQDPAAHGDDVRVCADRSGTAFARYAPGLTGNYDVYIYYGDLAEAETSALWTVRHKGGSAIQPMNQRHDPGWHFHGSYTLAADSCVELNALKAHAPVAADAVKFVPTARRTVERIAKDTLTPVTLNLGDELRFTLKNGQVRRVTLIATSAAIAARDKRGGIARYTFKADLEIDGRRHTIERTVPAQASFYEPLEADGLRVWLDAVTDIFTDDGGFMLQKDAAGGLPCRPTRKARLVVNDVADRICPEPLAWWYPEKKDHIAVEQCYRGEDVWMGPYDGKAAHGGLDINMKSGTVLTAPIAFDDHYLFNSLAMKDNNNRWRGVRRWPNGAVWWLQAHHLNRMLVPERGPLLRGKAYAETAGVYFGVVHHTHFVFRVFEEGESNLIDPWIFFWQTFRDNRTTDKTATTKTTTDSTTKDAKNTKEGLR